jgi:hypothetical protein
MTWSPPPAVEVDRRVATVVYAVGVVAAAAAAHHTGETGNWRPLLAVSMALSLAVLFFDET